ncbi:glycosyltransferase family 2 protein [Pricia antarctica]|nr:glycosyltransferase family 2 protein [Pricia antarctica]
MKFKLWLGFHKPSDVLVNETRPMVSVHLAICNEPPYMVISTLKEILKQEYAQIEIIVVDNNTTERDSWVPVEDFCSTLPNVRFFHLEKWPFFKSGALNFARKVTHRNAEFVFVIDADYRLTPNALELAVSNFDRPNTALVQFPQAYQCDSKRHVPLIAEFDHFFDFYCFKADTCHGALATGTLSLIKITALDKVGGWPTNSITEDAELGARLQVAGYDIKYVPRIIGKGIAPIEQEDFIKQRKRWIFGNVQTLMNYSMRPWHNFEKWVSGVSQLTAWINMLGMPILILLCCLMLTPWLNQATFVHLSGGAYIAYWIFILSKIVQLQLDQGRRGAGAFRTFLIHFSSLDIGAFDWWPAMWGKNRPFIRTNKNKVRSDYKVNLLYPFLHLSLFFCALGFDSIIIAVNAFTFATLHVMATRFDYLCRAGTNSQIALNLKLH